MFEVRARRSARAARLVPLVGVSFAALMLLAGCGSNSGGSLDGLDGGELPEGAECFEGTVQCTADGAGVQSCTGGQWGEPQTCAFGCNAGACLTQQVDGICASPIELELGVPSSSTTSGGLSTHTWSDACTRSYQGFSPVGPEKVFRFSLDESSAVAVDVTARAQTYFGVYLRAVCAAPGELSGACGGSAREGANVKLDYLLPAGEYYVLVDDFGKDGEGPGEFDLTVTRSTIPSCHGQTPVVLDLSSGSVTLEGNTAQGQSAAVWHAPQCPVIHESRGREQIYAVSVTTPVTLVAQATAIEPSPSRIGLYLRTTCENSLSQVACGYIDDMSSDPARLQADLAPGTYYLFVDDFIGSIDEPQTYTLQVDVMPR